MPINLKCVCAASMVINKGVWGVLLAVVAFSWYSTNQTKHIVIVQSGPHHHLIIIGFGII